MKTPSSRKHEEQIRDPVEVAERLPVGEHGFARYPCDVSLAPAYDRAA